MGDVSTETSAAAGKKKLWVTLGIVAAVLLLVGVGGYVWHLSPSFCGAVCHTPMDSYVKGYRSGDKALLITAHAEGPKALTCLDCHEARTSQQLHEAQAWITGNYRADLKERQFGTRTTCLASGCHDEDKIIKATANYGGAKGYNPHDPRHGKRQCYECHSMHRPSSLQCNKCHQLKTPAGWQAPPKPGRVVQN